MGSGLQIDTMKFYSQVQRIYNELRELGYTDESRLDVEALFEFDQYHFFGTDAVDAAIQRTGINASQHVLDVGSGIGGPARYLAHKTGCQVTAVELQPDAHRVALDLTSRCGLDHLVHHINADFLDSSKPYSDFDVVVSWFVFLHIAEREHLLSRCREALRPGGYLYVDDFHELGQLTAEERQSLAVNVFCEWLPNLELFATQCEQAGFVSVQVSDNTPAGVKFAMERIHHWQATRPHQIAVHGAEVTDGLEYFFRAVHDLFQGGHFGLARLLARNPLANERLDK